MVVTSQQGWSQLNRQCTSRDDVIHMSTCLLRRVARTSLVRPWRNEQYITIGYITYVNSTSTTLLHWAKPSTPTYNFVWSDKNNFWTGFLCLPKNFKAINWIKRKPLSFHHCQLTTYEAAIDMHVHLLTVLAVAFAEYDKNTFLGKTKRVTQKRQQVLRHMISQSQLSSYTKLTDCTCHATSSFTTQQ